MLLPCLPFQMINAPVNEGFALSEAFLHWHVRAENFLPLHFGSLPDFTTGYGMDEILGGGVFARR
jgi:hypothetical protein